MSSIFVNICFSKQRRKFVQDLPLPVQTVGVTNTFLQSFALYEKTCHFRWELCKKGVLGGLQIFTYQFSHLCSYKSKICTGTCLSPSYHQRGFCEVIKFSRTKQSFVRRWQIFLQKFALILVQATLLHLQVQVQIEDL